MTQNLDGDLTEEERSIRDVVHRFAAEVMRPAGQALDRCTAAEVIARDSILWDVHAKWNALGVRELTNEASGFTPAQLARVQCIVGEELGWGDAGLAISIGAGGFPTMLAEVSQNPELIAAFPPEKLGCWAITEPDHGSDVIDLDERGARPGLVKPNCVARRDGDFYVVNGQKAAWVSNGPVAETAALYTAVDNGNGVNGFGVFLVDLRLPGVSRGRPLEKFGQRALPQGEIFFEDVRIPATHMVIPAEMYAIGAELTLCSANTGMGSTFVGCARAAYEMALDYAKQRVQGGVPIIRHQAVKLKLFEMFRKVEAARSLNRSVMLHNMLNNPFLGAPAGALPAIQFAIASKVTSTQTAFDVASDALQIFGGNGLSHEYPIEKVLRDARASMIEDGTNEVLSLFAADKL